MQIPTSRLLLRDFVESDVAPVFSYQSDPIYLQHSPWATRSESESRAFVHMLVGWAHEEPRTKYQLAIVRQGAVIGNCGIRLASHGDSEAEFGCELAPSFWGNGYAAEANRAVLEFGFRTLRLQRVFSETVAPNTAAIAIAGRLGMKRETAKPVPRHTRNLSGTALAGRLSSPFRAVTDGLPHGARRPAAAPSAQQGKVAPSAA